jgi:hypothetical protein
MNNSKLKQPSTLSTATEQRLDQLLKQSFEPSEPLSVDFDAKVMSSIRYQAKKARNGRGVLIVMLLYWAAASLAGAWILLGGSPSGSAESASNIKLLLPLFGVIAAGLLFVVHQAKIRLSDLFLQTIR